MHPTDHPPIRGLLFDKDGTLLDFAATWYPETPAAHSSTAAHTAGSLRRISVITPRQSHEIHSRCRRSIMSLITVLAKLLRPE